MTIFVPMLGGEGWVKDPARQLVILYAHALVADGIQSTLFNGNVTSLPYITALYQNNPVELTNEIENSLTAYFDRFFVTTNVNVSYTQTNVNKYDLYISVEVTDVDGNVLSLADAAQIDNGILLSTIAKLNNGGN